MTAARPDLHRPRTNLHLPRAARRVLATALCASVVWVLFVRTVRPVDFEVFIDAGRAVGRGLTPYVDPSSPFLWSGHAFVYPYAMAWVFEPLGALHNSAAGLVYYVASVAALLATVRLTRGAGAGVVPVLVVLSSEPVVRALQLGTINVWLLLLLAVAWRYRERAAVVVVALSAAIVAKLFLLPMLAWLVLTGRIRAGIATVVVSAGLVLGGCLAAGQSVHTFTRMLSVLSEHEARQSSSLTAAGQALGLGHTAAFGVAVLVAVAILAAGWRATRRTGDEAYLFCAGVGASLAATPIMWTHYFTLLVLVPLIFRWRDRTLALIWLVTWLVETPAAGPGLYVLHPFVGAGWVWGGLVTAAVLVLRRRAARDARPAPH